MCIEVLATLVELWIVTMDGNDGLEEDAKNACLLGPRSRCPFVLRAVSFVSYIRL